MKAVEKYIKEHTRNGSNLLYRDYVGDFDKTVYQSWLTPDQARKAVEIAREEIYKWLEENAESFVVLADGKHPAIGDTKAFYGTKSLIHYLSSAMKDE